MLYNNAHAMHDSMKEERFKNQTVLIWTICWFDINVYTFNNVPLTQLPLEPHNSISRSYEEKVSSK